MGSMGSCSTLKKTDTKKEFNDMDFYMQDTENNDFYHGYTVLSDNDTKIQIMYSAKIKNFALPYVEINVDINSPKILVLSANTTFRKVIDKIINIWTTSLNSTPAIDENTLWQILENNKLFIDLVSVGSIKSVGDFFQEINSVVVNGGYKTDKPILKNQFRIGANGDQPSGVRAGFILLNANPDSLYPNAMAGYFSNTVDDNVVILHNIDESLLPIITTPLKLPKKKKGGKKTKKIKYITNKKSRKNL
jgi:hypothetical protein